MTTNNTQHSDLYAIYNLVESSMVLWPKEIVIYKLRDFFSRDSYYHFVTDHFGFPQTPDHSGLPHTAGYKDNLTTRVFIGAANRFDVIYYPSIIVKHGGASSIPISINREKASIQWDNRVFQDQFGNQKLIPYPKNYIFAGSWEGTLNIEITAKDPRARDDLTELVSILFTQIACDDMEKDGVAIKTGGVSASAPSDSLLEGFYKCTVTLSYRSEWRRLIPVATVLDAINTSVEFGRTDVLYYPIAQNLTIHTTQTLTDLINQL